MTKPDTSHLWVWAFDTHWPDADKYTHSALMEFITQNKIAGFGFGGDQFHNDCIHMKFNSGKVSLLAAESLQEADETFEKKLLKPLESALGGNTKRVWLAGNHDDLEYQFTESFPQVKGRIEREFSLGLKNRNWEFLPCGSIKQVGKLHVIHGETLSGKFYAQQAVDRYCCNLIFGHFHSIQSAIKVLPHNHSQKWAAWSMPCLGNLQAGYLRGKPTSWVNGFGIVEYMTDGMFNVHQIIVNRGRFAFGGKVYRG